VKHRPKFTYESFHPASEERWTAIRDKSFPKLDRATKLREMHGFH